VTPGGSVGPVTGGAAVACGCVVVLTPGGAGVVVVVDCGAGAAGVVA
jgi:hypothetical protein